MSKYDKEREKMGVKKVGSTSSVSSDKPKSKYDKVRQAIFSGGSVETAPVVKPLSDTQKFLVGTMQTNPMENVRKRERVEMVSDLSSMTLSTKKPTEALKTIPKVEKRGKVEKVADYLDGIQGAFTDSITFGLSNKIDRAIGNDTSNQDTIGGKIGQFAGYAMPGTLIEKGVGAVAKPLIGSLPKVAQQAITYGTAGAIDSAAQETGDVLLRDKEFDPLNVAIGGAVGGSLPVVGALAKKYGSSIVESLTKRSKARDIEPEIEEVTQRAFNDYGKQAGPTTPDDLIGKVFDEVSQRTTPPLENPKELFMYVKRNLSDVPDSELRKLSYDDLSELAEEVRKSTNLSDVSRQVAKDFGYEWDDIIKSASYSAKRMDGVQPSKYAAERQAIQTQDAQVSPVQPVSKYAKERATIPQGDELKFAQTVKQSDNTAPELTQALNETPMMGARTTDVLNRENAAKMIENYGNEGTTAKLLAKKSKLSPAEVTAAQILAKQYSSSGTKEGLEKAIQLVSKTAKEGREMGQAIQALSQWNKLDETGALLMGERQLNRGVENLDEWRTLTPEQAQPIRTAAQKIEKVENARSLAEQVMELVTRKSDGSPLTPDEKALIQQFQQQVKSINEGVKKILPSSTKKNTSDVAKIPPKQRTRDNVVSLLDAKAQKARERILARQNIGIVAQLDNPIVDYAIIAAAEMAKGIVKYSDYAEMMVKNYGKQIEPHLREVYIKATNMFRKENGLPTVEDLDRVVSQAIKKNKLDKELAESLQVMARQIGHMADHNLKLEATQDLQLALKGLGDSTLGQKISTLQTASQLLNAVTFGRNVIGNTTQITLEKMSKMSAVPIDWTLSKLTGERTIQFLPMNQEKFWRNFLAGTKAGWRGVSPTGTLNSYDVHPEVFSKRNPLRYLTKTLGASLQGFDYATYRLAYGDVVATYAEQLGKAQGLSRAEIKKQMPDLIKKLDNSIHDLADEAGLYATYQDETILSNAAVTLKKGLNKITDKPANMMVERGLLKKSVSTEGFGLGDILLKYAKTPANLVMRGIDYSPIGFMRSAMELAPLFVNRKKFNQFEATRALSRAITGTLGLTGMGYILADAGILSGSYSRDKDERSIQEQAGMGAYRVNWSALGRWLSSGFDKEAAKYQNGDRLMSYEWAQPAAISLAMGVNANKAIKDEPDATGWQVFKKSIVGGLESVLENPMVQGLSNTVDAVTELVKNQRTDKLQGMVKGVPASFVPTLLNQARTATDNVQRETRDEKLLTEMGNLIKNKIPGLSNNLPISYDSLGNERQRIQGGKEGTVAQYLTSFFSPAKLTQYEVSPDAKMVLDILNSTNDKTVLPRVVDKSIEVNDPTTGETKRITLTGQQYSDLQKAVGQATSQLIQDYSDFLSDPNTDVRAKVDMLKDIMSDIGAMARNDVRESMGYPKKAVR